MAPLMCLVTTRCRLFIYLLFFVYFCTLAHITDMEAITLVVVLGTPPPPFGPGYCVAVVSTW